MKSRTRDPPPVEIDTARQGGDEPTLVTGSGAGAPVKLSSSPPSPSPIEPSVQRRSSCGRLPRASVCREWEQPSRFPELSPNGPFGQLRCVPELMPTAFEFLFLFRMCCRKLRAQRRFREVPWSTDLVPSLTTGRLQLNWTFSFPREALYNLRHLWVR